MKNFKDARWLMDNFNNEKLLILDTRADVVDPDIGFQLYKEGHIEKAHFVDLETVMSGEKGQHGGRHPLPDLDDFIEDMKNLGMDDDSLVLIYDDGMIAMAARLWWLLRLIGKDRVYMLRGGIEAWKEIDGPITSEIIKPKRSEKLSLNFDDSMNVDMEYVRDRIDREDVAIVDARDYERYSGQFEPIDKVPGHIPSAINYPWTDLVLNGEILDKEGLKDKFRSLENYKEIIVHCGSGVTGVVDLMLMEEIGLKPVLYAAGYSDWISYEDNEVVVEEAERSRH